MAFNTNGFQTLYGFSMLDEMHNFMPELLYDEVLFPQVPLMWIRQRLRTLFPHVFVRQQNMYQIYMSAARRASFTAWENTLATPAPVPVPAGLRTPMNRSSIPTSPPLAPRRQRPREEETLLNLNRLGLTSILLDSLISFEVPPVDVPVIPTPDQIAAGSQGGFALSQIPPDTSCAICQEMGATTNTWRRLHCGHFFHNSCILPWFERNVHCPVCRADIREVPRTTE